MHRSWPVFSVAALDRVLDDKSGSWLEGPSYGSRCRLWPPPLVPGLGVPSQAVLATSLMTAQFPLRKGESESLPPEGLL